jgi:hypothetical protein
MQLTNTTAKNTCSSTATSQPRSGNSDQSGKKKIQIIRSSSFSKGVTPTAGSKIYRTTFYNIENLFEPEHFIKDTDTRTYLWPQPTNDDRKVLATGIDTTTKQVGIYLIEMGQDPIVSVDF